MNNLYSKDSVSISATLNNQSTEGQLICGAKPKQIVHFGLTQGMKAFTLAELIVSMLIISGLIVIIFVFVSANVEELANGRMIMATTEGALSFEEVMTKYREEGYTQTGKTIISLPNGNENDVLFLKKADNSAGLLVGIVNSGGYLQQNYVYGDNFIGYRELSQDEVNSILGNTGLVLGPTFPPFPKDKIFLNLRAKDFRLTSYNSGALIDLTMTIVKTFKDLDGTNLSKLSSDAIIGEYNLVL